MGTARAMPDLWMVNQLQTNAVERIQDTLKLSIKSQLGISIFKKLSTVIKTT